jgi:hypothetical protein
VAWVGLFFGEEEKNNVRISPETVPLSPPPAYVKLRPWDFLSESEIVGIVLFSWSTPRPPPTLLKWLCRTGIAEEMLL